MKSKILSIGDITADVFIKLTDVNIKKNMMCMRWGDKIPFESKTTIYAVGNSPNAAVSFARLGDESSLLSWIGDDNDGNKCIELLTLEKVGTDLVDKQTNKTTNVHYALSYDAERTILIHHEKFEYSLPKIPKDIKWFYFSSIGEAGENIHTKLAEILNERKEVKFVFQPGTFQFKLGYEKLKDLYMKSELVVCNKEESKLILETKETDIKILLKELHKKCGNIVSITDGVNGAAATDGNKFLFIPMYPDIKTPIERTGAGDAYTSTLVHYLSANLSLEEAMLRAPINSMNVVQHIGAQKGLLTKKAIEDLLKKAPKMYKVSCL